MSKALEKLQAYIKETNQYTHMITLLSWDMKTGMPKNGFEKHSDALTFFSTKEFERNTSKELEKLLEKLSEEKEFARLDDNWKFIVNKMKREVEKNKRIPKDFYESYIKEQAESENAWEKAKNASDFSMFAPHLKKIIEMTTQKIQYTNPDEDVYDVLLDQYEEGVDADTIDYLFDELKKELIPLLKKILAAKQPEEKIGQKSYPIEAQKKAQELLLSYIGFDWDKGVAAESEHPFTINFSAEDVRVTNHYHENDPVSAMFSAIHEGGHAIFEQNVNPKLDGTAGGSCCYMGIHESQSRFFENILGRNKNFWIPIYDDLLKILPQLEGISLDEFYHEINHVKNSLIRTDADELTYCFHIIMRYELERAIFKDHVKVEELPALWNQKMQEYLMIKPEDDASGILQDTHWSDGSFGYFPSYLLGSIYDGMFLEAVEEEMGPVDEILKAGHIQNITQWLNENIHQYGSTHLPKEVIQNVCHKEITTAPLIQYFKEKYTALYAI